jgi:hypothetical protein
MKLSFSLAANEFSIPILFNGSHELVAISLLTHLVLSKMANGLYPKLHMLTWISATLPIDTGW